MDEFFIELGESRVSGRLRIQEDRYQKTIDVLSDEVSGLISLNHTHPSRHFV